MKGVAYLFLGAAVMITALPISAQQATPTTWVLDGSTLTYHMSHPIHEVDGVSHSAKGKGVCHEGQCDFLLAVPVKTFDSGDTNRDLHMLQVTRGAQFPLVMVRLHIPEAALASPTLKCDIEVQFAGQTAHYLNLTFEQSTQGVDRHITGAIPLTLTDFKIDPPSFLTIPIKNEIPVKVDMNWQPASR